MKREANVKSQYKEEFLYQGSYGSVLYLPRVDVLTQLSLDPFQLSEAYKQKKVRDKAKSKSTSKNEVDFGVGEEEDDEDLLGDALESSYSGTTIQVPVPPSPNEAMINPRTKKKFPLGTDKDPETGEPLRKIDSVLQTRSIRNQIIYSDPDHGIVYYVDKDGTISNVQLGHLLPLSSNKNLILSTLDVKIPVKSKFTDASGSSKTWAADRMESLFFVDPTDNTPEASAKKERLQAKTSTNIDSSSGVPLFMYAKSPDFREFVHSELRSLEERYKRGSLAVRPRGKGAKNSVLGEYYAQLITAVLFADKYDSMFSSLQEEEASLLKVDPKDAPKIPHIKPDTRFLPHQAYSLAFLKERKAAMIDADPGAGKTLMLLADVLDKMNRGLVQRPCIVMPNSLLSDQKRELEEWTRGTINFIVINTDTVKRSDPEAGTFEKGVRKGLQKEGNKLKGLQELTKIIRSAPKNTIILTSYDWLRGGEDDKIETASGVRYRNPSWLVTRIGIDMLVLDESHVVRLNSGGEASGRAEAILQMSSLVPYKRCYSGTVAPSSPDDLFLQMSFLDPSVLGNRKGFLEKYALSVTRSKKVEEFKPGAIKQIRDLVSRRVGVSIRRSAWLSELPSIKVNYHKATLTGPQRIVYERLLDRIIKEELLGELEPGTIGLELQKAMKDQYASNPLARDKIAQWQKPSSASFTSYDKEVGEFVEMEYSLSGDDEDSKEVKKERENLLQEVKMDQALLKSLQDPSRGFEEWKSLGGGKGSGEDLASAFKSAQQRVAKLWQRYEAIQGEVDDAPEVEDFKPLLTKFIAIDKFLNFPPSDEFGQHFLFDEEDRTSPKIKVIDRLLASHFADPNNGKVIIFTHYQDVARHISESIQMSSKAVFYKAGETKALARFKKDPSVQILVAVEQSIQEGQNLQMANRIIRVDLPWNPGNYEQSIARSYRLPPKDPDAARYSTVYVDLVLCEGTAELTKFARMVSKMHAVRQLVSGYSSSSRFKLVGMSLQNMQMFNTFAAVQRHIDAFKEMRDYEQEEARLAPKVFGTESFSLATGEEMEGSDKVETPYVDSDLERGPWNVNPSKMSKGIINPRVSYFNGAYWLLLEYINGMKFVLEGFEKMETEGVLYHPFSTPRDALQLLSDIREKGIYVANQQSLLPKITGKVPVDPRFPQSKIDYSKLVTTASVITASSLDDIPNSRPGDATTKQILAYNPSQDQLRAARNLLSKSGKEVADVHVLAAAKMLGLFNIDPASVDVRNFYKKTFRFTIFSQNKKILQNQLSSVVETTSTPGQQAPSPVEEDSSIPGIDEPPSAVGIPVNLDVAVMGTIRGTRLVRYPVFIISDTSSFLAPGLMDKATDILRGMGFKHQDTSMRWLLLGETKAQAKSSLSDFARKVYIWYTIGNPDSFLSDMKSLGMSDSDIEDIFPREDFTAMLRAASLMHSFPEFSGLTRSIFLDKL